MSSKRSRSQATSGRKRRVRGSGTQLPMTATPRLPSPTERCAQLEAQLQAAYDRSRPEQLANEVASLANEVDQRRNAVRTLEQALVKERDALSAAMLNHQGKTQELLAATAVRQPVN